ncbi:hypothetical protein VSH64_07090 [Amycolatopsis rhabdoformis]|uniref:Uncharacterized protein n=1 Tax=Amycolatopsis rhabdoformis TaxID=1448059 RepID=A0ABZ1IBS6_9PSEU|nr:hypothetical protein [Amycolatopsis rhabdoformis]WSE31872.1 hypothetical protein VSH64_07090 [Amycolatopsis rhabdoformis]
MTNSAHTNPADTSVERPRTTRRRRRVIAAAAATAAAAGIATAAVWGGVAAGAPDPAPKTAAFVSTEDNPHPEDRTTTTAPRATGDRHGGPGTEPGDDRDARTPTPDARGFHPATPAPPTSTTYPARPRHHLEPGDDHGHHPEPGDDHGGRHGDDTRGGDDHGGDNGHGGPGRH